MKSTPPMKTGLTLCAATRRKNSPFASPVPRQTWLTENSTMNNARVSNEAKEHASDVLDNELHGDQPREELYNVRDQNKDPARVAGGLKA